MSGLGLFTRTRWADRAGLLSVLTITLMTLAAGVITPFDPQSRVAAAYLAPSAAHWFGTDEIGRDLFSRVLQGAQLTWLPAVTVIGLALFFGAAVGLVSGALGGWVDLTLQRVVDLFLVLPPMLIALTVVAVLGPGIVNTVIALVIFWWPWYARITRDEVRRLKGRPHFEAAQLGGIDPFCLWFRYLLPGAVPALVVAATLDVANVVLAMALMSFLGLGQPAPAAELGAMTARSLESLTVYWWLPILPAAAVWLMCLSANLAGDGLRSVLRGA